MKFDMGAAWNSATSMISRNRSVIAVVAGAFFFLPYFALSMFIPTAAAPDPATTADLEAAIAAISSVYAENWWAILLVFVAQGIGTLALLTLLTDRARPTVGEALKAGAIAFPSYFVANILSVLAIGIGFVLPVALLPFLVILAIPILFYLLVKFSLIMPAIAVDGILNPIKALTRSWQLTKGNSFRLFLFFFLLLLAITIVAGLASMVIAVIFAAVGGQAELIGNAFVGSLVNAMFVTVFLAVLAAVHRQLSGDQPEVLGEVFE